MGKFAAPYRDTLLVGDVMGENQNVSVLFLHGAGTADRTRYKELRELLAGKGISTCAFDFIGHGETGGSIESSSLRDRTEQVLTVIEHLGISQPLSIFGPSMSAYTAIKLVEKIRIESLILFVPAIYSASAYNINFGPNFTKEISKKESWQDSDAWPILENYKGRLLIIAAELDTVIPAEVPAIIYNRAGTSYKEIVTIAHAPHALANYLATHKQDLELVFAKLYNYVIKK